MSEAVNEHIRRGLVHRPGQPRFRQCTRRLGIQVDVSNVASTLEDREGSQAEQVLIDANIRLYAINVDSPFHEAAYNWLDKELNGSRRVAIPTGSPPVQP